MVEIGPVVIRLYGIIVGLGILAGYWVAARMASRFALYPKPYTLDPHAVWDTLWWVVIPGMIGARLYHVIDYWQYYRENLFLIPAVWTGGMGIFGAIAGGILGLWLYCWWKCRKESRSRAAASTHSAKDSGQEFSPTERIGSSMRVGSAVGRFASSFTRGLAGLRVPLTRALLRWYEWLGGKPGRRGLRKFVRHTLYEKISVLFSSCVRKKFLAFSDLAAFGLPVGQAIGRWGNFFNRELYGLPTDLPWGLAIPTEKRLSGFGQYTYFHPLFLYESLWSLLTFGVLLLVFRLRGSLLKSGSYFSMYLMLYGVGRLFLEGLRIQAWTTAGFNVAQSLSILGIVGSVVYLYSLKSK